MSAPPVDERQDKAVHPVDLAATAPFRLGDLDVTPPTRQVRGPDGIEHTVEPRVLQVLIVLAEADSGVVSRDALTQRCWDGRVVGEDSIHRAIAKARRVAELSTPPAFVIESISRVGYRLLTGASVSHEGAGKPRGSVLLRRRGLIAGGVVALAAAGGGAAYLTRRRAPPPDPLIAVLPFDNLSVDPQLGYFADGLSEDILNALIRGGGVRVTSRTSSFTFRGAAKARAAQVLKADYLLDGSVLRDGARLRVNAHLTQVSNQQTLWSQTYDRDLGQGLQIEDEVAAKVASALKVRFGAGGLANRLVDPAVYDLYLRGREATRQHTPQAMREGNVLLRSVVAQAPTFAAGWLELAKNYQRNGALEPIREQQVGYALGLQAARRAVELDPRNGEVYGLLAQLTPAFGHWRELEAGLAHGLRLAPNDPDLLIWQAMFLFKAGRYKAALQFARRSQALDPLDLQANHWLCVQLTGTSQFKNAEAAAARLEAIWPGRLAAYWDRFWLLFATGRDAEAVVMLNDREHRPAGESTEYEVLAEALTARVGGSEAQRHKAGDALIGLSELGSGYAANSILVLSRLGQFDRALDLARALYLRKGPLRVNHDVQFQGNSRYPPHGEEDPNILFRPFVAPLRKSGRLDEIFDGIGLTALWRASGPPDA
jgi:TolB-like protein/DNA-binding winged helix-turn-helix (wHTH) protein/tetratricopeptide (TPR) repeat protein